jgi:hypothetical protein
MAISPTNIRMLFTNYDIITYFLNLASCSEHFISIKHRILATKIANKLYCILLTTLELEKKPDMKFIILISNLKVMSPSVFS